MSEYGIYNGDELLSLSANTNKPIIDGILWEQDAVLLVGKEKAGKSILAQQIAFCISAGEPFLGEYFTEKGYIVYVQLEGKLSESKERVEHMLEGIHWESGNFNLLFHFNLPLNNEQGITRLFTYIDARLEAQKMEFPKLIILDPLYMCIRGDLSSQEEATNMCVNFRQIIDRYRCALMVVHHEHKIKRNQITGELMYEGDNASFGSFVWKAFPDHILLLEKGRGLETTLSCSTQRSSRVIGKVEMNLLEPVPLMFEVKGDVKPMIRKVEIHLGNVKEATLEDIARSLMLSYGVVQKAITNLRKDNKVECVGNVRPRIWRLK